MTGEFLFTGTVVCFAPEHALTTLVSYPCQVWAQTITHAEEKVLKWYIDHGYDVAEVLFSERS